MNLQTLFVLSVVIMIFVSILIVAIRNKKQGKSSCSCVGGCNKCEHSEFCHH